MANRRMFSNRIANSARFLQMPAESQLLYFHMVLRADDDGIVEAYPLIKLLGTPTDSMKVLLVKGMIKQLNEDQVVVVTDWSEHNIIRADRKVNSIYLPLMREKYPELTTREPKARSDVKDNSKRLDGGLSTDGISKVKLSKVNTTEQSSEGKEISEIIFLFKEVNPTVEKYYGNITQRSAVKRMLKAYTREKLEVMIKSLPEINKRQFWPKSTTPCQLENNIPIYKAKNDENKSKVEKNRVAIII